MSGRLFRCTDHPETPKALRLQGFRSGTPNGIRTRAATLRGWCPRPLDDGGLRVLAGRETTSVGLQGCRGTVRYRPGEATTLSDRHAGREMARVSVVADPRGPSGRGRLQAGEPDLDLDALGTGDEHLPDVAVGDVRHAEAAAVALEPADEVVEVVTVERDMIHEALTLPRALGQMDAGVITVVEPVAGEAKRGSWAVGETDRVDEEVPHRTEVLGHDQHMVQPHVSEVSTRVCRTPWPRPRPSLDGRRHTTLPMRA